MRKLFIAAGVMAASMAFAASSQAQEFKLRLHQLLPAQATIPKLALTPWIAKVEKESGGRIKIEHYPAMQLSGSPASLYDQCKDGVVDMVWTVLGYTPGRFPKTEAFELPFMVSTGTATSQAFDEFVRKEAMDEFKDVHPIVFHTHGPGLIHVKGDGVKSLEDMKGLKLRGPTRIVTNLLSQLGATPVGMPVPAVPESISKGVIQGAVIPWEVTLPLKLSQLVNTHTAFSGDRGLYTATFIFAMNNASYNKLPPDLKKVIDDNSGTAVAKLFGIAMDEGDVDGLKVAEKAGNKIIKINAADTEKWKKASEPVVADWIKEMKGKGIDGEKLVKEAKALVAKYSK